MFKIQSGAKQQIGPLNITFDKKTIDDRIKCRMPIMKTDELILDWSLLNDIFAKVTATVAEYHDLFGKIAKVLRKPKYLPPLSKKLVRAWFDETTLVATITVGGAKKCFLLDFMMRGLRQITASSSRGRTATSIFAGYLL